MRNISSYYINPIDMGRANEWDTQLFEQPCGTR
jgi:hypothetical protein